MNNKNYRGSLAIKPGRTVMHGFWPLDLDLRASNRSSRDLIVAVQNESGGSDSLARGAAARVAGGDAPAAALCCRVAGDGSPSVPGLEIERAWVGEDLRVMRDPPVAFTGLGEVCGGGCTGDGGSARRGLAGASALGDARGYGLRQKAQKAWDGLRVLTEGPKRPELQPGVAVDGGRRRRTGRARERTVAGRLRVCRCVEEVRAGAAKG